MFNLNGSPYLLDATASAQVGQRLADIEERVLLLRRNGTLTEQTLRDYYGEKRFEQVAESNAIEGSTLSAGETELAVLRGVTITGHDPMYVKDAMALDRALRRMTELARDRNNPTNIEQLHDVHGLLLEGRPGAGIFRNEPVTIRGARHTPPKTWQDIMTMMTQWHSWSVENRDSPAPIRAALLQAWLTHIHPFIDGNGRVSRAIGNLELIRSGYPPIIIKKKERARYMEALAESDEGGDIRSFLELIFDRIESGLTGLESSAKRKQGFDPIMLKLRQRQERQLQVWETSVGLLASIVALRLTEQLEPNGGTAIIGTYDSPLDLDDYVEVCLGKNVPRSWAFSVHIQMPGLPRLEKLAYIGHRSNQLFQHLNREGGPSLYWSSKNPAGFPKWLTDGDLSPYAMEMTLTAGNGDAWIVRRPDGSFINIQTTALASGIANALLRSLAAD